MSKPKKIQSPEQLWKLFEDYFKQVKSKPRKKYHLNVKTGEMVPEPLEVPLTKEGFYNFCAHIADIQTLKDYFSNKDDRYTDYAPICTRIIGVIRQDQIEGGMVGQYNHSLTARLNGLADKVENELTGKEGKPIEHKVDITLNLNQ
jgi:hypothetical protein